MSTVSFARITAPRSAGIPLGRSSGGVRSAGQIRLDGRLLTQPYVFAVIGDPDTLEPALRIPGGVFAVLDERGATPTLTAAQDVVVDAVRPATAAQYAKPVGSS